MTDAPRWKIVAHDNYDRDTVSEWLVCENFRNEETAIVVCKFLNEECRFGPNWWLRVTPQDKPLYKWEL